jgi:hypothetical protein
LRYCIQENGGHVPAVLLSSPNAMMAFRQTDQMDERAVTEEILSGSVAGKLLRCPDATTGVVVLSGSSGRVDVARARLFADEDVSALALQWFGGEGQIPGICEIPLETFFAATDCLVGLGCRRIVYVGTSKGAEASLLAAAHDPRIDAVIAISPTSVVWGNIGPRWHRLARAIFMDA